MTIPLYTQMSPFSQDNTSKLIGLMGYHKEGNGIVKSLPNGFTQAQYVPSDHPNHWDQQARSRPYRTSYSTFAPYEDEEFLYTVNEYNFRTKDTFDRNNPGLLSLGCSHTYGVGLRDDETWPYMLSKKLGLPNWNAGCGGESIDYCVYMFRQFISAKYIPKCLAIWWPDVSRLIVAGESASSVDSAILDTIIHEKNKICNDVFSLSSHTPPHGLPANIQIPLKGHLAKSSIQLNTEFLLKRELVLSLCKIHNIKVMEFLGLGNENHLLHSLFDNKVISNDEVVNYKDPEILEERARDGMHCSPTVMSCVADVFEINFRQRYGNFV